MTKNQSRNAADIPETKAKHSGVKKGDPGIVTNNPGAKVAFPQSVKIDSGTQLTIPEQKLSIPQRITTLPGKKATDSSINISITIFN